MVLVLCSLLGVAEAKPKQPVPTIKTVEQVEAAAPAIAPEHEAAIRELLAQTKAADAAVASMDAMIEQLKPTQPSIPPEFWTQFKAEVNGEDLIALLVPVYAKHFTLEDVEAQIAFYKTPLGQKMLVVTPALTRDSMAVGSVWGQELARRALMKSSTGQ